VKFLKSTILTGLYVLLPIMLMWIGLREIGGLLAEMATPLADMVPGHYFDELTLPGVIAALLITAASFIIGIAARIKALEQIGSKFEHAVLYRIPMYQMLKVISSALVKSETSSVSAAIVRDDDGGGDPCYVMEEHDNDLATVLLPWSPASFAGSIKVVPKAKLEYLDCSIDEYSRSVSLMGIGIADCIAKNDPTTVKDQ
jgi:uncharacterized membrane protein